MSAREACHVPGVAGRRAAKRREVCWKVVPFASGCGVAASVLPRDAYLKLGYVVKSQIDWRMRCFFCHRAPGEVLLCRAELLQLELSVDAD